MSMKLNVSNILFLDIECVPQHGSFFDLEDGMKELWEKKAKRLASHLYLDEEPPADDLYENRSGIFAEFGKIIVVSVGYFAKTDSGSREFRVKSFYGDDEKTVLTEFFDLLNSYYDKSFHQLCGHNIKEFDVPYICRRAMVNGLDLPNIIDTQGKKPWEVNHIDTLEMWKFGDRKNFVSLDLLCRVLGVETPKDDISGEQVARAYWVDKDLERIRVYCEKDVVATAKVLVRMTNVQEEVGDVEIS